MKPELVKPSIKYKTSLIKAFEEGFSFGTSPQFSEEKIAEIADDFEKYLAELQDCSGEIECPDGNVYQKVPAEHYFLVSGTEFIAAISLRHYLNDFLLKFGGHIGYAVRPKYRRHGYGSLMLSLCLDKARELNLDKVLITCSDDNVGSYKIIENNGGILENIVQYDWHNAKIRRYWISL